MMEDKDVAVKGRSWEICATDQVISSEGFQEIGADSFVYDMDDW